MRTLFTSSLLKAASRSAKLALRTAPLLSEAPGGKASTLSGPRGPHRAPAQYAARIKIAITAKGRRTELVFADAIGDLQAPVMQMIAQVKAAGSVRGSSKPQLGGKRIHLLLGRFQRARAIDSFCCERQLFLDRHLHGDTLLRFGFAQASLN